jgi:serine/threonine-protein kinase
VALKPGDIVGGKFRVDRVLGEGGMGIVVAATHLQLGQTVALKCMRPEVVSPSYTKRFMREARASVKLKSQHAARVLDVGAFDDGTPYIVMEYLDGIDLSDLLKQRGRLPVTEAVEYILQACEAIGEAHSYGIVHRDIKPANLFLAQGPGGPTIKVLDFGVSKFVDIESQTDATNPGGRLREDRPRPPRVQDSVVTRASDLLGSPSYMAPEQVLNASAADTRSDIWSLGVILFKLVCGRGPFTAESLGELVQQVMKNRIPTVGELLPGCPPGFSDVVARCLERDRLKRFADIPELARALAPYAPQANTPSLERAAILGASFAYTPAPARVMPQMPIQPALLGVAGAQLPPSAVVQQPPASPAGYPRASLPEIATQQPPRYGLVIATGVLAVLAFFAAAFLAMRSPQSSTPPGAPSSSVSAARLPVPTQGPAPVPAQVDAGAKPSVTVLSPPPTALPSPGTGGPVLVSPPPAPTAPAPSARPR